MKVLKRIMCIVLCLFVVFGAGITAFAKKDLLVSKPLRFDENGNFRIMHVTDTHLEYSNVKESVMLIAQACDREKPDLIVLTGDISMNSDSSETLYCIDKLMSVFDKRNIPVAVTFGNHDSQESFTREQLMEIYNRFPCSISIDDKDALPGCGTYRVPVLGSKDDDLKFNLWIFDSGSYDDERHYANVLEKQVAWYEDESKEIEKANGKKINGLVFQHIIVPEIYEGLSRSKSWGIYKYRHMYDDGYYYFFNQNGDNHGVLSETPCCGYYNHGQFNKMVERGDILAMFTGHDHTNCFSVKVRGINICNSLSTRYNGDAFSTQYGYRIIDLYEKNTSEYTSRVVHWYDFYDKSCFTDIPFPKNKDEFTLEAKILFLGFFEKTYRTASHIISDVFLMRTTEYK